MSSWSRQTSQWNEFSALCREAGLKRHEDIIDVGKYLSNVGEAWVINEPYSDRAQRYMSNHVYLRSHPEIQTKFQVYDAWLTQRIKAFRGGRQSRAQGTLKKFARKGTVAAVRARAFTGSAKKAGLSAKSSRERMLEKALDKATAELNLSGRTNAAKLARQIADKQRHEGVTNLATGHWLQDKKRAAKKRLAEKQIEARRKAAKQRLAAKRDKATLDRIAASKERAKENLKRKREVERIRAGKIFGLTSREAEAVAMEAEDNAIEDMMRAYDAQGHQQGFHPFGQPAGAITQIVEETADDVMRALAEDNDAFQEAQAAFVARATAEEQRLALQRQQAQAAAEELMIQAVEDDYNIEQAIAQAEARAGMDVARASMDEVNMASPPRRQLTNEPNSRKRGAVDVEGSYDVQPWKPKVSESQQRSFTQWLLGYNKPAPVMEL